MAAVALAAVVGVTGSDFAGAGGPPQTSSGSGLPTRAGASASGSARLASSGLKLVLSGTIVGTPGGALISVAGGQDELFTVGQAITRGVFLADVHRHAVVIRRDDVLEKLQLRRAAGVGSTPGVAPDATAAPAISPPAAHAEAAREREDISYSVRRDFANKLFESAEPSAHAAVVPAPDGGMQLSEIAPGSLYERLGLSEGDAIRTVNGAPVNTIEDLSILSQQRNNTDKLLVGFVRGGNPYNVQFDPEHGIEIEAVRAPAE
ncbi:MAG: type II secretion system protein N [Burkholderiales bacterium]